MSSRLAEPLTSPETYWSILKTFVNNKKIPSILPLFHENKFVTGFKEKAELFNHFFVNQCSLLSNNSVLPTDLPQLTNKCLDSIHFSSSDIAKIITHFDPNKAHGHDMLSIRIIKLCGNSICKPLSIIFNDCLNEDKFPHEWKKTNVVPLHKKGNKQSLKNYRPLSLLPICRKFITKCLPFLLRTIWSLQINQDLGLEILVLTTITCHYPRIYINRLIRGLRWEGFLWYI